MYQFKFSSKRNWDGFLFGLVTITLSLLFVYLGCWQWNRRLEKIALQTDLQQKSNQPPLELTEAQWQALDTIPELSTALRYRSVKITGKFLTQHTILLDNQTWRGQAGYQVLTPFLPRNTSKAVLISRGFIPMGQTRSQLPNVSTPSNDITLVGSLNIPHRKIVLKKDEPLHLPVAWPLRVQNINFEALDTLLDLTFYPFLIQATDPSVESVFSFPAAIGVSPDRHLGYAVQWFTMAAAVLIYFCVIAIRRAKGSSTQRDSDNAS